LNYKVKLAAIAKNEAAYIPQWVYHHLFFGFDCIEIWVNDTTDNSIDIISKISTKLSTDKIRHRVADDLLQKCKATGKNFQIEAYSEIFKNAKQEGFTHIFFLDIDELWTPIDFSKSIKEVLLESTNVDAISFQWMIDIPDLNRSDFERPFNPPCKLTKDRHVKTITKISDKVKEIQVHNTVIEEGVYKLSDGSLFLETEKDQHSRSKVSLERFNSTRDILESSFILHLVHKSQREYLASLLRGRQHVNNDHIFKNNRWGYLQIPNQGISFTIGTKKIEEYNQGFELFIQESRIFDELVKAQHFVTRKFNSAILILTSDITLVDKYSEQLKGLNLREASPNLPIINHTLNNIEKVVLTEHNTVRIYGWAFYPFSKEPISVEIIFPDPEGADIKKTIKITERPDVLESYPYATLNCGFALEININTESTTKLVSKIEALELVIKSKNLHSSIHLKSNQLWLNTINKLTTTSHGNL